MNRYEERVGRGLREWGEKFDASELEACPDIRHFYITTTARVKVEGPFGVRYGRISTTTGWRPAWLLVHRSTDSGSWDVLGPDDRVTAVQVGGKYRPAMSVTRSREI